jgi:hypothetical protein
LGANHTPHTLLNVALAMFASVQGLQHLKKPEYPAPCLNKIIPLAVVPDFCISLPVS